MEKQQLRLSGRKVGDRLTIRSIESHELLSTLMRVGIVPGDEVKVSNKAALKGPIAISSGGNKVALRYEDAGKVWVEEIK